ncbi:MAG: hypothetical protein VST66_07175, partial [Nitrospirota bacterium]|nr:hypothetical protein [Nitrospirota bacterium]
TWLGPRLGWSETRQDSAPTGAPESPSWYHFTPRRMLKKSASGVLVARRPQRTLLYALASWLPAALLDGPF